MSGGDLLRATLRARRGGVALAAAGGPYAQLWRAWTADRQSSSRIQSPERSQ